MPKPELTRVTVGISNGGPFPFLDFQIQNPPKQVPTFADLMLVKLHVPQTYADLRLYAALSLTSEAVAGLDITDDNQHLRVLRGIYSDDYLKAVQAIRQAVVENQSHDTDPRLLMRHTLALEWGVAALHAPRNLVTVQIPDANAPSGERPPAQWTDRIFIAFWREIREKVVDDYRLDLLPIV